MQTDIQPSDVLADYNPRDFHEQFREHGIKDEETINQNAFMRFLCAGLFLLLCAVVWWGNKGWARKLPVLVVYVAGDGSTVVRQQSTVPLPTESVLRHFIEQFVVANFSRVKATIAQDIETANNFKNESLFNRDKAERDRTRLVERVVKDPNDYRVVWRATVLEDYREKLPLLAQDPNTVMKARVEYDLVANDRQSGERIGKLISCTAVIRYYITPPDSEQMAESLVASNKNPIGFTVSDVLVEVKQPEQQ